MVGQTILLFAQAQVGEREVVAQRGPVLAAKVDPAALHEAVKLGELFDRFHTFSRLEQFDGKLGQQAEDLRHFVGLLGQFERLPQLPLEEVGPFLIQKGIVERVALLRDSFQRSYG